MCTYSRFLSCKYTLHLTPLLINIIVSCTYAGKSDNHTKTASASVDAAAPTAEIYEEIDQRATCGEVELSTNAAYGIVKK